MSDWWRTAVFYQVYLRSFQDSNGDGIGDLSGIIHRLDYLQDLGVNALWICPFYPSPGIDFGYDITDHTAVDPIFGSVADFQNLIQAANQRDIKIVVDIILNHTSDQHPYFVESRRSRQSPKRDWYIWRDAKPDGSPPNNWEGFERSCWTWDPHTEQYYYHFYYRQQPDLNWRNPEVVDAMFSICNFWLDQGVAGLRLDAINTVFEDPQLRDNPIVDRLPDYLRNIFQFNQLPIHNIDHPDNHQLLQKLRHYTRTHHPADPLLIGEVWVPTHTSLRQYYGEGDNEIQLPFNFFLSTVPTLQASAFRDIIQATEQNLAEFPTTSVLSNHDFPRSTERYAAPEESDAIAKLLATMLLTLRGIPFIYYGEELGMRDTPPERLEDVQDPRGRLRWPEYKGRDGCRTPMQWTAQPQAGFTTGKPWNQLGPDYVHRNVETQQADPDSIWHHYRQLIQLRKTLPALQGDLTLVGEDQQVLAYVRSAKGQRVLVCLNMSGQMQEFHWGDEPVGPATTWAIAASTHARPKEPVSNHINLMPFEGVILLDGQE